MVTDYSNKYPLFVHAGNNFNITVWHDQLILTVCGDLGTDVYVLSNYNSLASHFSHAWCSSVPNASDCYVIFNIHDLLSFHGPYCSIQRRTHQQRRDHGVFHAGQCYLFQTWPGLFTQLPGNHLHEAYLLWQLLRICKSLGQTGSRCNVESNWNAECFFLLFYCSCGASLNKVTDAEVFMTMDTSYFLD